MTTSSESRGRFGIGIALLVAAGLGYAIARYTGRSAPNPVATPEVEAVKAQTLEMPQSYLSTMEIGVEAAAAGDLGSQIQATATVMASPNNQAVVTTPAAGTIVRLERRLGETVKAGDVLARLESREAAQMVSDKASAEARAVAARSALKREQELFEQRVTPRQDLEAAQSIAAAAEAEAARARMAAGAARVTADGRSMVVVSPIAGRVTAAPAQLGAFVAPDAELFRVADPRFVVVEASVPAVDAAQINAGDMATVTTSGGRTIAATVQSVTPTVNEQTRSATVLLNLAAGEHALMPGELARAQITPKRGSHEGVVVPEDAVQVVDGRNVVFARTETGFKVLPITVGTRSGGRVLILTGVIAGQQIATRNAFLLKAEFAKGSGDEEE